MCRFFGLQSCFLWRFEFAGVACFCVAWLWALLSGVRVLCCGAGFLVLCAFALRGVFVACFVFVFGVRCLACMRLFFVASFFVIGFAPYWAA